MKHPTRVATDAQAISEQVRVYEPAQGLEAFCSTSDLVYSASIGTLIYLQNYPEDVLPIRAYEDEEWVHVFMQSPIGKRLIELNPTLDPSAACISALEYSLTAMRRDGVIVRKDDDHYHLYKSHASFSVDGFKETQEAYQLLKPFAYQYFSSSVSRLLSWTTDAESCRIMTELWNREHCEFFATRKLLNAEWDSIVMFKAQLAATRKEPKYKNKTAIHPGLLTLVKLLDEYFKYNIRTSLIKQY